MQLAEKFAPSIQTDIEYVKTMLAKLPFELTASQKKSLWEVIQDIEKPLFGDIGGGTRMGHFRRGMDASSSKISPDYAHTAIFRMEEK